MIYSFPKQVLRGRIGERKLSKTNTDGVSDFQGCFLRRRL